MNDLSHVSFDEISHEQQAVELLKKRVELYKADLPAAERAKRAFQLRVEELRWNKLFFLEES